MDAKKLDSLSTQGKKILLAEDDELFRSTMKKSLQKKGYEVIEAPNGKAAKELLLLQKVDLIISDIQMPHFSGIDLLDWVKTNCPTPVILMTGFSQALETRKAHDLGATDFLAKPFKDADLQEVLSKHFAESKPTPQATKDVDKEFCKVSLEDFISEKENETTIYIRISSSKYIKIAHPGGKISEDRIKSYRDRGVNFVYVKREDFRKVVRFNLAVAKIVSKNDKVSDEKKLNFLRNTSELILESAFVNGVNEENFHEAKDFLGATLETLTDDEQMFTLLGVLSSHADYLYAHSLGVSTFSVMIGRELGWNSSTTLFKLALGGLFHDIGKKEIPKSILDKPRALLTQVERNLIETHPSRGKEILESLPHLPQEVLDIAYHHHEDMLGTGFPRRITKHEIHPLAKVVQVANIFCEYAIKHHPSIKPKDVLTALAQMERMKVDCLDHEAFTALKRLCKI